MGKPNAFLLKYQADKELAIRQTRRETVDIMLQMCADGAAIAANRTFHRRGKIIEDFTKEMVSYVIEMAELMIEDAECDEERVYMKTTTDTQLEYVYKKPVMPWDERYADCGKPDNRWRKNRRERRKEQRRAGST